MTLVSGSLAKLCRDVRRVGADTVSAELGRSRATPERRGACLCVVVSGKPCWMTEEGVYRHEHDVLGRLCWGAVEVAVALFHILMERWTFQIDDMFSSFVEHKPDSQYNQHSQGAQACKALMPSLR